MSEANQETSVTSTQDRITPVEVNENGTALERNEETKAEYEGSKSTVEELFPWISEFKKKCRCLLAQPNIVSLIKLMKFYARNVSVNVTECYTKPYRAAKLKDSISETLLFFLFFYRELVEICDRNSYLDKMSDLLAMYMDMELKASRRGKEHHSKIAARLSSCLFVYLENSNDHILDTFIKAKFINRNYHDILDPILTKISKTIPARHNCDTMYVRYLLIYRLWKKVNSNATVKNQINSTAISHLGPPPVCPTPFLAKYVLPKVPKSQANSTKFLLLHKFDIEQSCKLFIQYCKENREDEDQGDLGKPNFTPNVPSLDNLKVLGGSGMCRDTNHIDNLNDNVNIPGAETCQRNLVKTNCICSGSGICMGKCSAQEGTKSVNNIKTKHESSKVIPLKPHKPGKVPPRPKSKKTGDILYIDLTTEEITEKVIKKKKQLKLHWLAEVKKKLNTKSAKTGEKKKKAQSDASNSFNNLPLPGIIDSTSAKSLSTATTPEPSVLPVNDVTNPVSPASLPSVTTQVPENCVLSNFANDFVPAENLANSNKDETPEFAEKLTTCGATKTVTIPCTDSSHMLKRDTNCNNSLFEIQSETSVAQLSNTLSHMCETYGDDSSTTENNNENHVNSPSKQNETGTLTASTENDSMSMVHKQVLSTGREQICETSEAYRSPSQSSDVAVIFTRDASDVAIVDLDEYAEDNTEISESCKNSKITCEIENIRLDSSLSSYFTSDAIRENNIRNDLPRIKDEFNNDLTNITFHTNKLRLTNSGETYLNTLNDTVQEQSVDDENKSGKIHNVINFAVKEESTDNVAAFEVIDSENTNSAKFHLQDNVNQIIVDAIKEPEVDNKIMIAIEKEEEVDSYHCQIEQNTEESFEKSEPIKYDIMKQYDYKSSEGDQFDGTELTKFTELEIVERQQHDFKNKESESETADKLTTSVENEYVDEQTLIPKINETLICTENIDDNIHDISNDLLASQESQFRENIDGLSLLASVSQHVSNLEYSEKSLTKPKIVDEEISCLATKIKRSHLLRNNGVIKEVSNEILLDVNNTISCKSINEIQDIWQKINDNKIHGTDLGLESSNNNITENESLDMIPLVLETTVDLNSSTLHNNMISVDNVTQMIKDSTNVIVNGETVVLLQKSPNSNLYIINKASDNTAECLDEDKKSTTNTTKRISTAMRDIMNHIPINLSRKNTDRQDGGKIQRYKVHTVGKNKVSRQLKSVVDRCCQHRNKSDIGYIKKEIVSKSNYDEIFRQRSTDTPQSVIELESIETPLPHLTRLTETPTDVQMTTNQRVSQESGVINMTTTGRLSGKLSSKKHEDKVKGTSIENVTFKHNIKQEFESCLDGSSTERSSCYGSQLTPGDFHLQVSKKNYNNINSSNMLPLNPRSTPKIPHVYSTVTTSANLYSLEHEHCDCAPCNMKVSSSQPYQTIPQPIPTCQLSHCACLKCAYELHYRQYLPHSSYLQSNSYFVPTDAKPTSKNNVVQEKALKLTEAVLAKFDDDQLLHKIEQSIIDNKVSNPTNAKNNVPDVKYKPEFDSKLPLKKRLKAHAMMSMSYQDTPIKLEKVENYPGTPMMSIAALEARNLTQNAVPVFEQKPTMPSAVIELSPRLKDDSSHHTTEMIRRDYLKDTSLTSIGNCVNVDEKTRKMNHHRRQTAAEVNVTASGCQKSFKTPAQRKEISISSPTSLKRKTTTVPNHPKSPKKVKKANVGKTKGRQTRSSTRNIPKVDYNYDGIIDLADPKLNTFTELKRKRKKTGR
ncbi:uncharacterized protein LOC107222300 [Neodiprion lecontei]|uniref:Uncharacterized protein LOC107222300 n=1 Tax=Neodiprion lecontei TaxID=441921 RepID=A0A6J0BS13_NEOLC|nr:uncharacterized protein LOC107222300 [Neodiprion lecontei]